MVLNSLFGSPSRSYIQKTPPNTRNAPNYPLPPSPSPSHGVGSQTPQLLDHAFSPNADLLLTPERTLSPRNGIQTSHTMSSFGTSTRSRKSDASVKQRKESPSRAAEGRSVPALEDFELVRVIGKGCAGRVMMVRHHPTATIHAMKAISKRSVLAHDELAHTLTEIKTLKQFAVYEPNNPFIVKLNYAFTDKENIYFVMDFYPGGDLATQMEIGTLGHTRTRFYAAEITQGLMDLHRHGIIVRDLKPENVLLDADGHAVLADFGLSKRFAYRGEPQPILVPQYPDRPVVPYWAGTGLGSMRIGLNGQPRVAVDRANSFVGTAEYISPEVIKCAQYSYAIDWWALGCIIVEGIVGRVPFRLHSDEPPELLWDRILLDSWRDVFYDAKVAEKSLEEYLLDDGTLDFIDSLLEKDPMMRLTEPHIVQHTFFYGLEWDTVAKRGYADPHGLMIHPKIEYNLHYFPRLCLEETPTVDMGTQDLGGGRCVDENGVPIAKTALNDDEIFDIAHAEAEEAFQSFEWSRDDLPWARQELERETVGLGLGLEGEGEDGQTLNWSVSSESEAAGAYSGLAPAEDLPAVPVLEGAMGPGDESPEPEVETGRPSIETVPAESIPLPNDGASTSEDQPLSLSSPLSTEALAADLDTGPKSQIDGSSPSTIPAPLSPVSSLSRLQPPSSPKAIKIPSPRPKSKLKLPPGLPASGLSVSDIISIPSPDVNSPTRLVRRHNPGLSIDTIPNPRLSVDLHGTISQLGDEDWEQLDNTDNASIPSIPNAAPSAFFTRGFGHTLRRRPSAIGSSGLRRAHKTSTASSSGESNTNTNASGSRNTSPTKHRQLFTVKSIENTKKAFKSFKVFPKMKRDTRPRVGGVGSVTAPASPNIGIPTPTTSRPAPLAPSPSGKKENKRSPPLVPALPGTTGVASSSVSASAPNTGTSSWFTTRRFGISRSFKPSNTTTSSASSGSSTALPQPTARPSVDKGIGSAGAPGMGVPRVELTHTPPIVWELESEPIKPAISPQRQGSQGEREGENKMEKEEKEPTKPMSELEKKVDTISIVSPTK